MSDDDAELVALIDNELDESRKNALLARLAANEELRTRYDELRQISAPLAASFETLLEQAPLSRLRTALPLDKPPRLRRTRLGGVALRELAAGLVLGAIAAATGIWAASAEAVMAAAMLVTACLKTSLPCIRSLPAVWVEETPPSA